METSVFRKTAGIASLCLALGLGAAACTKKAAAVRAAPATRGDCARGAAGTTRTTASSAPRRRRRAP